MNPQLFPSEMHPPYFKMDAMNVKRFIIYRLFTSIRCRNIVQLLLRFSYICKIVYNGDEKENEIIQYTIKGR